MNMLLMRDGRSKEVRKDVGYSDARTSKNWQGFGLYLTCNWSNLGQSAWDDSSASSD